MKKYDLNFVDDDLKRTLQSDVLNRNSKLVNLMKLINVIDENFIISLDGDWGCGKTFFVKQLIYLSNCEDISFFSDDKQSIIRAFSNKNFIVYYNAWENDDHNNPLESIIYYILNEFPEKKNDMVNNEKIFDLVKTSLMNFVEKSSFGILKKEDLARLSSFKDIADSISTIEEKKFALNELFNYLVSSDNRLLLIIDELDRCKPDYAVKVLETIKHFYNNKNITILVVTNNSQLSHTISHYYGYNFDGYSYLNKIYDTVITLSKDHKDTYVKYLFGFLNDSHLPEKISQLSFEYFDFSYREINRFFSMYKIVKPYTEYTDGFNRNAFLPQSRVFLPLVLSIKIKNIGLYNDFLSGKGVQLLKDIFDDTKIKSEKIIDYSWLCGIFEKKEDESLVDAIIREYKKIFVKSNFSETFPFMEAISMLGNLIYVDK